MKKLKKNNENFFNTIEIHRNIICLSNGQSTCKMDNWKEINGKLVRCTEGNMVNWYYGQ